MALRLGTSDPGLPRDATPAQIIDLCNRLLVGQINCTLAITLRASQTTTVVLDNRLGATSWLGPMPLTANARTALDSLYVTGRSKGTATLNHPSNAATDQNFLVAILGG